MKIEIYDVELKGMEKIFHSIRQKFVKLRNSR